MLKKNEVIEVLENGGFIYAEKHARRAHVYTVSDALVGICRFDTAEKIASMIDYEVERECDPSVYRIHNPIAVNAEKAAAAHELASIRTPGHIEIEAKNDCRIGGQYVAKGRRYIITVYGDGTQEQPGNAYGKLYDFRTREHAVYFEIVSRPEGDDIDAQSAPAEEPAPAALPAPKQYARADGEAATRSASEALSWHRAGHDLIVAAPGKNAVYVHGAAQETAREEDENRAHCKRIAYELDAYVSGEVRRCPDCGEEIRRDWDEVGDAFKCPHCGEIASPDDWEELSVYDFLSDALDIEYRCGSDREYRSACIMVACGGPNIYLDTASKDVELYWWGERARYPMSYEAVDALDQWAEEYWNM